MKTNIVLICVVALTIGCARFKTTQTDYRYDEQGNVSTKIETKASASTFFAGKSALANWKAQQSEKSQGAEVGSVNQEVTDVGNQIAIIAESVTKGVVSGMK